MISKGISQYYVQISLSLFCLCYLIWFPEQWMITDAHNYSLQALAISNGQFQCIQHDFISGLEVNQINAPYLLGNAFYLSMFSFIFGKSGIFLSGMCGVLFSVLFLRKALQANRYPSYSIVLLFLCVPIMFFARTLMAAIPSMIVISAFFWAFSIKQKTYLNLILLGFTAGISLWFRETNAIITGLGCLYLFYKKPSVGPWIFIGGSIGLVVRFITSYLFYGKVFFLSASSGFGIDLLFQHSVLYVTLGLVLIPAGLFWVLKYKGTADRYWKLTTALFFLAYISYSYSAISYSGWIKGTLLTSRFVIPWIPMAVLAFGYFLKNNKQLDKITRKFGLYFSLFFIIVFQCIFSNYYQGHEDASKKLASSYQNEAVIYDQSGFTNIIRYINPLTGEWQKLADIQSWSDNRSNRGKKAFLILSRTSANLDKMERANRYDKLLDSKNSRFVESIAIDEYNWLDVYQTTY